MNPMKCRLYPEATTLSIYRGIVGSAFPIVSATAENELILFPDSNTSHDEWIGVQFYVGFGWVIWGWT